MKVERNITESIKLKQLDEQNILLPQTKHIESSSLHNKVFNKIITENFDMEPSNYTINRIEKKLFETRNSKQFANKQTFLYRYHCKDSNSDWKIFAFKAKSINEADKQLITKMKNDGYILKELAFVKPTHKNLKKGDNVLIDDTKKFDYDNMHNLETGKVIKINTNFSADIKLDDSGSVETCSFDILRKTVK